MFAHNKRLQYTVRVSQTDPVLANLMLEQFGGPQGELAAAMRYFTQAIAEDDPGRRDMLYDIATEELSHLEVIGTIVCMLNKGMKGAVAEGLTEQGIAYITLTGQTKDRETPVRRFQDGEVPVFLISLKAGGTGLTLTRADTVIHYDPWWNPAVENQATDRAHRIGQDKTVFVYKLIAEGTVEEKMVELQSKKQALVDSVLSGTGAGLSFTEADIEALFAPLPELDA